MKKILNWTYLLPLLGWVLYFTLPIGENSIVNIVAGLFLIGGVMAAVHHAEIVAHRVGEPYGTIILAVAVTVLEASIIVSLMLAGGKGAETYARDTLFAAIMLILNGIIGISMVVGALKYKEQTFETKSATIPLVGLVSILVLTLVLPNFTTSILGPQYSVPQLVIVTVACLVIYSTFLFTQTIRHREYFLPDSTEDEHVIISTRQALASVFFLLVSLGLVILLAKKLSPVIESGLVAAGLPSALVGVFIAAIILLPEGISAIRAARKNRFQTSLNLALGSALASIGLSIPTVAILCTAMDLPLVLGLDRKSMLLLGLSIFTVMLSLNKGRTNGMYGTVLLVNLMMYIFTIVYE